MKNKKNKNKDTKRIERRRKIIAAFILFSLILPTVYLSIKLIVGDGLDSDTLLMLTQCLLGIFAFFLPNIISKRLKLEIPPLIYLFFIIFLYASIFLGEVRNFYYRFTHWDDILHFSSGMMLGAIGFSLVDLLNKNAKGIQLSPVFECVFAISFALSIGALWEIYEYAFDGLLGLNMQKFALSDGTELVGHAAISDTMKDLIVDLGGATLMAVLGYIAIKRDVEWFEDNVSIKSK